MTKKIKITADDVPGKTVGMVDLKEFEVAKAVARCIGQAAELRYLVDWLDRRGVDMREAL